MNDPSLSLLERLARAHALATRALDAGLAAQGLTRPEYSGLAALRAAGPPHAMGAGALAAAMRLSPAATTNRIDRLERAGLVARRAVPGDGRAVLVALTAQGQARAEEAARAQEEQERRLLRGMGPLQERNLAELLGVLADSVVANAPER